MPDPISNDPVKPSDDSELPNPTDPIDPEENDPEDSEEEGEG